jgi:hypothetical protein
MKEKLQEYLNRAEIIDSKRVANISELESRV